MQIRELSTEQCLEILKRTTLGHLACAVGQQPYVVPIHFSFDAERNCMYGFSAVGQKIASMRENPLVCIEIPEIGDKNRWTMALVFGRYQEIQDSPEYAGRANGCVISFRSGGSGGCPRRESSDRASLTPS